MKRCEGDTELAPEFEKDGATEAFLERLNEILGVYEESTYEDSLDEEFPTVHIVGCPRSGTTLLTQIIASHLTVGYVNNLVAAFWAAPCFGIQLSRHLGLESLASDYSSDFGRTRAIHEPHEFGYFWASLLGYRHLAYPSRMEREGVDWQRVRRVIVNMTRVQRAPMVFKSFMLSWYLKEMIAVLPRTCFVWMRRDPVQNALSILRARERYSGRDDNWIGLKPPEFEWLQHETPAVQVAGQVVFVNKLLQTQISALGDDRVLPLRYEEVCKSPRETLSKVEALIRGQGGRVERKGTALDGFEARVLRDARPEDRSLVEEAIRRFSAGTG